MIINNFLVIDFGRGFTIKAQLERKRVHILLDRFVIKIFIVVNIYFLTDLFGIEKFKPLKLTVLPNIWCRTTTINLLFFVHR